MPCNTVVTNTVELSLKTDPEIMLKALQATYGYVDHNAAVPDVAKRWFRFESGRYTVTIDGMKVSSQMPEAQLLEQVGIIKQSYAVAAMQASAKRFGWAMKETKAAPAVQRRA